ncbi:MAG: L,D-transpeptidase family protein [Sphingomonas sp.]
MMFVALLVAPVGNRASPIDDAVAVAAASAPGPRISYPAGKRPQLTLPNGSRAAIRSLLNIAAPMKFGDFVWNDAGVPPGPAWVRVDLARQTLSVFRAGHEIGAAVILYGADSKQTPIGVFPILEKAKEHRSSVYDADMPFMLRLTGDGVAIHASQVRGGYATHGCVGVPFEFARHLFNELKVKDLVAIVGGGSKIS